MVWSRPRMRPTFRRRRRSDRLFADRSLARAIAEGAVTVAFQPQIEPLSGVVMGVEALARWTGAADAEQLFARARLAGLEPRLNRHIQSRAIHAAAAWTGPAALLSLSINVLPEEIGDARFCGWILRECANAGLAPSRLSLELVERGVLDLDERAHASLSELRASGVKLLLDDFGSGESGLGRLAGLPIDGIKLDRAFVTEMAHEGRYRVVVAAMLDLARALGLKTVVEGVETTGQLDLLAMWGCDLYQGFLDAGPLAEHEMLRFVAAANQARYAA